MLNEIWKDIAGYEGQYQVSNLGRVKSLNYRQTGRPAIISYSLVCGYKRVALSRFNKRKDFFVHRLVWEAFNGPIPSGMQVNHINEDKEDNRLDNLNLMSPKENTNWGTGVERRAQKRGYPIVQMNDDGETVAIYRSLSEAKSRTGFATGNISRACNGKYKQAYGFKWAKL